jgi:hypothetical protein
MKKQSLLCLIFLLLAASIAAQTARPNFAGNWTVNLVRSNAGEGPRFFAGRLGIAQTDSVIMIKRTYEREGEEFAVTDTLALNGKERALQGMFNSKRNVAASLVQDTLLIKSKIVFERDGETNEMTSTEKWTLKEDGKTIALDVKTLSSWGEMGLVLIYDKAGETKP